MPLLSWLEIKYSSTDFIRSRKGTILLGVLIAASLTIYFSFSLYFFPVFYMSKHFVSKAVPVITNVKLSTSEVPIGNSFNISVTSNNQGDTADIQIVSISFPNLTSIGNNDIIKIKNHKDEEITIEKLVEQYYNNSSYYFTLKDCEW